MTLAREAWGPSGDPACHLSLRDLRAGLAALPPDGSDQGTLALIVIRRADGERLTPGEAMLDIERGLIGDGWERRPPRELDAQLAVTRRRVAELIAGGQALPLGGDNLFVDLDISAGNLPTGTQLAVGEATVEVSPKPHNGCAKYAERFGADALRFVQDSRHRDQNLRGIYWRVTASGRIWTGAPIRISSRP